MTSTEDPQGCDRDRLWAFAVGALTEEEARSLDEHLTGCPSCREGLETIQADMDALGWQAAGDRSPEQLAEQVLARSRGLQAKAKRLRWLALTLVLSAALVGGVYTAHRLTEKALARSHLWTVEHAIQRIQNSEGSYPANEAELIQALARLKDPDLRLDEGGRPLDYWGQPFRYRYPGVQVRGMFDLWSIGANGVDEAGGPDDQTNWR